VTGRRVGPVLMSGGAASAIVAALRAVNPGVEVADHGSYLRESAPAPCSLRRALLEEELGESFRPPADLERARWSPSPDACTSIPTRVAASC